MSMAQKLMDNIIKVILYFSFFFIRKYYYIVKNETGSMIHFIMVPSNSY